MLIQEWEGHSLCSRRDPLKEASQWAHAQTPPADHCWVLGLGAGYHVEQLALRFPNVLISVVDHRDALKIHFREHFSTLKAQVQIEIIHSEEELLISKSFSLFGGSLSPVLLFRPSIQTHESFYQNISKSLRGQTPKSCSILSDMLNIGLSLDSISRMKEFQIKEISQALPQQGSDEAQSLIKVLRELVV